MDSEYVQLLLSVSTFLKMLHLQCPEVDLLLNLVSARMVPEMTSSMKRVIGKNKVDAWRSMENLRFGQPTDISKRVVSNGTAAAIRGMLGGDPEYEDALGHLDEYAKGPRTEDSKNTVFGKIVTAVKAIMAGKKLSRLNARSLKAPLPREGLRRRLGRYRTKGSWSSTLRVLSYQTNCG